MVLLLTLTLAYVVASYRDCLSAVPSRHARLGSIEGIGSLLVSTCSATSSVRVRRFVSSGHVSGKRGCNFPSGVLVRNCC